MSNKPKVKTEEKKKAFIEVVEHTEFKGDMKTNILSSIEMAKVVSSLFAPAFHDYYGCNVRINDGRNPLIANTMPIGAIYVDLYFKDYGEAADGTWKNVIPRAQAVKGKDMGSRYLSVVGNANNSRAYEVTKETYEALEEFTFANGRIRWSDYTQEMTTQMSAYGKDEVVVCISGLSLNKIITKIYGEKTEEGRFEYIAHPSTMIPSQAQEFIMQVSQLDLKTVRHLQEALGVFGNNAPQFHQYNRL